jgi:hypothetical protein
LVVRGSAGDVLRAVLADTAADVERWQLLDAERLVHRGDAVGIRGFLAEHGSYAREQSGVVTGGGELQLGDGFLVFAGFAQKPAVGRVQHVVLRARGGGVAVSCECELLLAAGFERHRTVQQQVRMLGDLFQGAVHHRERPRRVVLVEQQLRQVHSRIGQLGVELAGRLVLAFRTGFVLQALQRHAEVKRRLRVLRILRARLLQDRLCAGKVLLFERAHPLLHVGVRSRRRPSRRAPARFRLLQRGIRWRGRGGGTRRTHQSQSKAGMKLHDLAISSRCAMVESKRTLMVSMRSGSVIFVPLSPVT